jgi:phage baseplate assembly protein gpV
LKFKSASLAFALVIFACAALTVAAQKKTGATSAAGVFSQDRAKFAIKLDGQTVGHEDFEIAPNGGGWLAKGTSDIKLPTGGSSKVSGTLTLQPDGAPISYDWTAQAEKTNGAHIIFANGVASITLEMQGARPFQQDLTFNSPMIAVLDNNLYHQYAVLARVYDWTKRGTQTFPVLIPQELTPGSITVESTGSASADGKSFEGLKVTTSDLEILLLLDSNHRLMRLEVPSAKVSVIRE